MRLVVACSGWEGLAFSKWAETNWSRLQKMIRLLPFRKDANVIQNLIETKLLTTPRTGASRSSREVDSEMIDMN
jgi:hypothetical protein